MVLSTVRVLDRRFGAGSPTGEPTFVTFQQHYEMAVTVFYEDPAPAEWSSFPDA